ncbi:MAG: DUF2220 family protein [Treponema sp.]|jgi:hypothetical protein|nr:DUF2220 family protein [Treponema sp.]
MSKRREWLKATASGYDLGAVQPETVQPVVVRPAAIQPLEINLDIPTEQDALRQPDRVREWISVWKAWRGSGTLVWAERHWRSLGTQTVPEKLILESPDDVAKWIDELARWTRAVNRFKSLVQRWPILIDALPKHFNVLTDYDDSDFLNLSEMLSWLCANPRSNLYIRQVPVVGIDSKWLESRKGLVCELFATIQGDTSGERNFFKQCGFKPQPQLIRMRILDKDLRSQFNGLSDVSAPLEEITALDISPAITFIVENIQTALAFNDFKNAVVLMGLGYGVDVLGKIPWLRYTRCIYWGDIDTHGFAILNRARSYLPHLETVLMDEATHLSHRTLWVEEKEQHAAAELPLLTDVEQMLFQSLKNNVWGNHVRLEQERIRWDEAWNVLQNLSHK